VVVAQDLVNFAVRNGAGTPLAPGQMVQAQGFVNTPSGSKTTFATEAHVDQQGNLVGHLELNDHLSGFSIPAGTVSSATLSGAQFTINGTFVAGDGSTQSFTAAGDAAAQSVNITTSTGFTASGTLGGGNVTIKK